VWSKPRGESLRLNILFHRHSNTHTYKVIYREKIVPIFSVRLPAIARSVNVVRTTNLWLNLPSVIYSLVNFKNQRYHSLREIFIYYHVKYIQMMNRYKKVKCYVNRKLKSLDYSYYRSIDLIQS